MNPRAYYLNFTFDFGVLAQKCFKLCVNGVLKFQFFFLNLSSKVLAGVGVRTSKYPYMDICGVHFLKPWVGRLNKTITDVSDSSSGLI